MHRARTAFLALLLALAPGAAAEEEARPQDETAPAATSSPGGDGGAHPRQAPTLLPPPPVHRLESVVVSATRVETPASEIASSVTVLDGEALRRQQHHLVVDALRQVPGVDVRQSGGPGHQTSVFLRGADSDHTLVLLDGVELNDPSSPNRIPILSHLTLDNVERIEVLRGPQSGVWGSDAIGGVINIVTRTGEGPPSGALAAEGGSFASSRARFDVAGSTGRLRYALGGSLFDTEGFSAIEAGEEDDGYRNATGSARLRLALSPAVEVDLALHHTDARVEFDGFGFDGSVADDERNTDVEQSVVRLAPRWRLLDGAWEQRLGLRYARTERETRGGSALPGDFEGEFFGVDWRHDVELLEGQVTTLGFEGEWEEADTPGVNDDARTWSVFLQQQISWGPLFGALSGRFDDHSEFGSDLTYRAALGYRIAETGTTLRASYGTGFKAPSLSELAPEAFAGNPDLEEEESRGVDVGVEQRLWGDRVTLGVTYFQNWFDDLIVAVAPDPSDPFRFLNVNVEEARSLGVETFADLRLSDGIRLRVHYTHTDTEARDDPQRFGLVEDESLLRRPEHKAGLVLDTHWLAERGDLAIQVDWVGPREDLDPLQSSARVRTDDHVVVDLRGGYRITDALRIFARVENLFDEEYQDVVGFGTAGISGYGGLEVRF